MKRDDLREVIARAIAGVALEQEYEGDAESEWRQAIPAANIILSAFDAAGMKCVPKEPTEAMIAAGHQQIDWCRNDQKTDTPYDPSQVSMTGGVRVGTYCGEDIVDAYRAMIAVEEE